MIARILFLIVALAVLGALMYLQQGGSGSQSGANNPAEPTGALPGFTAIGAQIIETGDNGQPLYRLDAKRIEQPVPGGTVFLTDPVVHYQPPGGSPWVLSAQKGQLPQSAHTAELSGSVDAQGTPAGSRERVRFRTDQLHLDMQKQLATTADVVHVNWGGSVVSGRGMRADLKNGQVQLFRDVSGVMQNLQRP